MDSNSCRSPRIIGHCNNPALPFCLVCGRGISSCSVLKYWLENGKQEVLGCCNVRESYRPALDQGYLPVTAKALYYLGQDVPPRRRSLRRSRLRRRHRNDERRRRLTLASHDFHRGFWASTRVSQSLSDLLPLPPFKAVACSPSNGERAEGATGSWRFGSFYIKDYCSQ